MSDKSSRRELLRRHPVQELKGNLMSSNESTKFSQSCATVSERLSDPDVDLVTIRDIIEMVPTAAKELEGVTYAEVDKGERAIS